MESLTLARLLTDSVIKIAMGEFTYFVKFPPELRLHIWRHALDKEADLPERREQTLYTYRTGVRFLEHQCWKPLKFSWDFLKAYIYMLLLFVNYEARNVALG